MPANGTNVTSNNTTNVAESDTDETARNDSVASAGNMTNATDVPMVKVSVTRERKRLHYVTLKVGDEPPVLGSHA